MTELTGIGTLLRGLGVLYVLVAVASVGLALYLPKGWRRKAAVASITLALFGIVPAMQWMEKREREAYAKAAWAHFKRLCDEKSGEKIYKTFTGVNSVLVIRPLPAATDADLSNQHWLGDPYSNATPGDRARSAALKLASPRDPVTYDEVGRGFDAVESVLPEANGEARGIVRYHYPNVERHVEQAVESPISRFGVSWEDISRSEDRKYWVAGSRLRVVDLSNNSVVAERIGYLIESGFGMRAGARIPWLSSRGRNTTCPSIRNGSFEDRWFVLKVLNPAQEKSDGR